MSVEERLIASLLDGSTTLDTARGSTSQIITACLAVGRFGDLPEPYRDSKQAWLRLDMRQRALVRKFNPTFRDDQWEGPSSYGLGA